MESYEVAPVVGPIERVLQARRSMDMALSELRASFERRPSALLSRMIDHLEAEITIRKQARSEPR